MSVSEGNGAGLTAKERLERIENLLDRIDTKLDSKADYALVVSLQARLDSIERDGSPQARSASRHIAELSADVAVLKSNATTEEAVRRYRKWLFWTAIPALTAITYTIVQIIEGLAQAGGS